MKDRITLWGELKENGKAFLAIELLTSESKVRIRAIPESVLTEDLVRRLEQNWRAGEDIEWPEGIETIERSLNIIESMLPEHILVKKPDIIKNIQAEWHFHVLSAKLSEVYKLELEELKTKINQIDTYSKDVWDELKEFWSKVQGQIKENNLMRRHARNLRKETDTLFNSLKEMRKKLREAFAQKSAEAVQQVYLSLQKIEERVNKGDALRPLFNELKEIQNGLKKLSLTRQDRDNVWKQIDAAFKVVKEKQGIGQEGKKGGESRLEKRLQGLLQAIQRVEKSLQRDKSDLAFQNKRINNTEGQLEVQLREAKKIMINQRIDSKEKKLAELHEVRQELEAKLKKEKARQEKLKKKLAIEATKKSLHQQHQEKIRAAEKERASDTKILEAAKKIAESKQAKKILHTAENIADEIEELFDDTVATIKSVTALISDRLDTFMTTTEEE